MKKTFTLLLSCIVSIAAQAQIPNGDFENWTYATGYSTPDGWDNPNSLTAPNSVYTCERGTTGAPSGSSFLMLTNKVAGSSTAPGLAVCSKYDFVNHQPTSGFPYTGRPLSLTGKWQYMANGTDKGRIGVVLTKWNITTNKSDVVAEVEYDLPGMVMSWTSFSIPLTYLSSNTPDTAYIGLVASNNSVTAGSYLYVDNLNFSGTAANVPVTVYPRYNIALSPNPARDNIKLDFGTAITDDVHILVMDLFAHVIANVTYYAGQQVYNVNLNKAAPGMYFVITEIGEDRQSQRLVIQ